MAEHNLSDMPPSREAQKPALPPASADWALFLDIDGTLLDLAPTPDTVTVPRDLPDAIDNVSRALGGAVALVSGRTVEWIDRTFAPLRLPAAGQHGAELRLTANGAVHDRPQIGDLAPVVAWVTAAVGEWPGVVVEDKGVSLAVHYRLAPERAADVRHVLARAAAEAGERFHLMSGKMVLELKPAGSTKGIVVAAMMDVPPFLGRRPVFIGDDRTDEDGFREVLARGGLAVQVGPSRSRIASHCVADPTALRRWLAALPQELRRGAA